MSIAALQSAFTRSFLPPPKGKVYDMPLTRAFLADCAAENDKARGSCSPFRSASEPASAQLARERADDPPAERDTPQK